MSAHDSSNQKSSGEFQRMIREIEQVDPDLILAVVPGSQLHQIINSSNTNAADDELAS